MELSPLDIQKQTFSVGFRGYSADEVRAYLHLVAEEMEMLLKRIDRIEQENAALREDARDQADRERILKDTLLSAQKVSEQIRENASKEAELVVRNAELVAERIVDQTMERIAELERTIGDLKIERKSLRNKLTAIIETFSQMVEMDVEQEALEEPITQLYRARQKQ
jgi:cell division initiation protein